DSQMCQSATLRTLAAASILAVSSCLAWGQSTGIDWRHIGNAAIELALPSLATGAVDRVWYSEDGSTLYARTASGRTLATKDYETWQRITNSAVVPPASAAAAPVPGRAPEAGLRVTHPTVGSKRYYAIGSQAYRSDDGGLSWTNLTAYRGTSILG